MDRQSEREEGIITTITSQPRFRFREKKTRREEKMEKKRMREKWFGGREQRRGKKRILRGREKK